jgi:putative acetyltransferase
MPDAADAPLVIRPLRPADLDDTLDMWVAAWQAAYPAIDFSARRGWIAERIAGGQAHVAVLDERIVGLLVIEPMSGYLDQLVVATDCQRRGIGSRLLVEAKHLSPALVTLHVNQDNARALRLYESSGFVREREDVNPTSGAPTYLMAWKR